MRIEKKDRKVLVIQEEVKIVQGDHDIILEEGDKIEVLPERDETFSYVGNNWRFFSKNPNLGFLSTLEKDIGDGQIVSIVYEGAEREPFEVLLRDGKIGSTRIYSSISFVNAELVKKYLLDQWGLTIRTEDLNRLPTIWVREGKDKLKQEEVHLNPVNIQRAVDAYHKAVSAGEDKVVDWALEKLKVEVADDIWNLNSKDFNLLWDNLVKYKFL